MEKRDLICEQCGSTTKKYYKIKESFKKETQKGEVWRVTILAKLCKKCYKSRRK